MTAEVEDSTATRRQSEEHEQLDGRETSPASSGQDQLGHRAASGAVVTVSAQILKIGVQVLAVVILARLLTPRDYGLVAMVLAVVGVAEIFREFGLSSAAISAKVLSRGQRDNLFWINTGAGLVLMGAIMLAAPLIALWYDRPELVALTRGLAPVFVINGMATQYRADLTRHLRFKRLALADAVAPVIGLGIAIAVALLGGAYWALVAQQLTVSVVLLVVLAAGARWLPRGIDRRAPMRSLVSFGWNLAGAQLVGYAARNVDSITIGTRFGATALGLYNRAFQLLMTPLGQLRAPTTTVAVPVLVRLHEDKAATDRFIQRGQLALGLTLVAGLGLVLGAAAPITVIFLGQQWLSVEPILRLLAVAGMFQTLAYVGYWIYLAHGMTKELLRYTLLTAPITIVCVIAGSQWGVLGVAWGYLLAAAVEWPLSFWYISKRSTIAVRPLLIGAARILFVSGYVAAAAWAACALLAEANSFVQLVGSVVAAALAYASCALLPGYRRDIAGVFRLARKGVARRGP